MSDATEFQLVLWNLNYENEGVKDDADSSNEETQFTKEFPKEKNTSQKKEKSSQKNRKF